MLSIFLSNIRVMTDLRNIFIKTLNYFFKENWANHNYNSTVVENLTNMYIYKLKRKQI